MIQDRNEHSAQYSADPDDKGNALYALLVGAVSDYAIFAIDTQGTVLTWNAGAQRLKGYSADEIIGLNISKFFLPQDVEAGKPAMELRIAAAEGRFEDEGWRLRKDGSLFWASATVTALRDEKRVLKGFGKVIRDLTKKKQAEEALKQSQERYRLLIESVEDYSIMMLDPSGRVTSWNEGAKRINGYEANEILGSHFSRFYLRQDILARRPEMELQSALQNGRAEIEGWRVHKTGKRFWANVVIIPVRDASGTLRGYSKVTRDITERRQTDESLRQSEERFRLMISSVKDYAIFMLDPSGNIATWNEGAYRTKGYEASEIIGKHFSIFYSEEDNANGKPADELQEAIRMGRLEDSGWRLRKDGSRFWANVIITAVRDPDGKLLGFAKVTRDLTESREVQEKLRMVNENLEQRVLERTRELAKAKDLAVQAVRAREQFLSIASHELKTPLTSMKLQIQMRQRKFQRGHHSMLEPRQFKNLIDNDERQVNRLIRLVDDMLDITRLRNGKLNLEPEITDLIELAREVLLRFQPHLDSAGIKADLKVLGSCVGHWDRYRIDQVVTNLLTNAMKYGDSKPITVEIRQEGKTAFLKVCDQGIGISKEDQARVFNQFERAVSAKEIGGLGLGLYIAKEIVEAHAGTIKVESEPGNGTAFTVALPI